MSKKIFFDSDCLSAFLAVSRLGIPVVIYGSNIVIPRSVVRELLRAREEGFQEQIDKVVNSKIAKIKDIEVGSEAAELYFQFTEKPMEGFLEVGSGEAAAMALAITEKGILASNNLKDVSAYVKEYGIEHVTTGTIIHIAVENGVITKNDASVVWREMVLHGCKLGAQTYEEYVEKKGFDLLF